MTGDDFAPQAGQPIPFPLLSLILLVVGSRGAGLSKVLVGRTATTLAAHAKVPVLVAGGTSSPAWRG